MNPLAKNKTTVLTADGEAAAEQLAAEAQRQVEALQFDNPALKKLANYAAVQLAQAQDHKEAKDWWDRCFTAAKNAKAAVDRGEIEKKREKLRKLAAKR